MAYIIKRKNQQGVEYVYLVEGYRVGKKVKQRTLKSYGRLDDLENSEPGAFERLKMEAKRNALANFEPKVAPLYLDTTVGLSEKTQTYGWKLLDEIFEGLNTPIFWKRCAKVPQPDKVDHLLRNLVFNRILYPAERRNLLLNQDYLFSSEKFNRRSIKRHMKNMINHTDGLQRYLHDAIKEKIGRSRRYIMHDINNFYFESTMSALEQVNASNTLTNQEDSIRIAPQQFRRSLLGEMSIFMDTNSLPVSYMPLTQGADKFSSYLENIRSARQNFGMRQCLLVTSKPIYSRQNLTRAKDAGVDWLFFVKNSGKSGYPKKIHDFVADWNGWTYSSDRNFAKKSMIRTRQLEGGKTIQEKILAIWHRSYSAREKNRRRNAIQFVEILLNPERYRNFFTDQPQLNTFSEKRKDSQQDAKLVDKKFINLEALFDGTNILITSDVHMSDEEMLQHYQELIRIEEYFYITKAETQIYDSFGLHSQNLMEQFLISYLGIMLTRILQFHTHQRIKPRVLCEALNSAKVLPLPNGYASVEGNKNFSHLLRLLGISWDKQFIPMEKLEVFGKGWFSKE